MKISIDGEYVDDCGGGGGSPPVPVATDTTPGIVQPDGTTIKVNSGIISTAGRGLKIHTVTTALETVNITKDNIDEIQRTVWRIGSHTAQLVTAIKFVVDPVEFPIDEYAYKIHLIIDNKAMSSADTIADLFRFECGNTAVNLDSFNGTCSNAISFQGRVAALPRFIEDWAGPEVTIVDAILYPSVTDFINNSRRLMLGTAYCNYD